LVGQGGAARGEDEDAHWPALSAAERRIAVRAACGLHNREIAEETGLTEGTVKVHLNRIFRKLGIDSRIALVRDYGARVQVEAWGRISL
jgi:DNA-binding NarL/FixJ family response regulator